MLEIRRGASGEIVLVGRFDASQADSAAAFFDGVSAGADVDCAGLDYISSMGLGILLKTQKRLRAGGAALKLVRVNRHVRDVLHYAGFQQIFEIEAEGGS